MKKILKTLVIDGEPMALDKLRVLLEQVEGLQIVKECKDTSEALEYMNGNTVDVIFTEISMPGSSNGIEFIESLPVRPLVVFVTAQSSYAVDAFRLSAIDFISKPYVMADIQRAVYRIRRASLSECEPTDPVVAETSASAGPGYLFIRNEREYEKVALSDIRYISGDAEYLSLHIAGHDKPLREKSSFASIRRLLTPEFVQIHRSSIINMQHVKQVGKMYVVMDDGVRIRISESNRGRFYSQVAALTVGKKMDAAVSSE